MTQYETPYYTSDVDQEPPKTSGLAITSLVCSLICCIPVVPLIGSLLGIGAIISIGNNPRRQGKGIAIAGIILGLIFTLGHAYFGMHLYRGWILTSDAPYTALEPGFRGDYASTRAHFGAAGMRVTDDEAQQFIEELRSRYGNLLGSHMDFDGFQRWQQPQPGQTEVTLFWTLVFDRAEVAAEGTFSGDDQVSNDSIIFRSITIRDPQFGDLTFPPPPVSP